jgi:hypothetical protein
MPRAKLNNMKFGRLTVIAFSHRKNEKCYWKCQCICSNITYVHTSNLIREHTQSCGCLHKERISIFNKTHGMSCEPEYNTWVNMKRRCYEHNNKSYSEYGGRGIKVYKRWFNSFENFYKDMGDRPSPKHSIDRIDNNGNYEPDNCRWATKKEQNNNTRKNIKITFNNNIHTISQWSQILNINEGTLRNRLYKRNWSIKKAFTTPVSIKYRSKSSTH